MHIILYKISHFTLITYNVFRNRSELIHLCILFCCIGGSCAADDTKCEEGSPMSSHLIREYKKGLITWWYLGIGVFILDTIVSVPFSYCHQHFNEL